MIETNTYDVLFLDDQIVMRSIDDIQLAIQQGLIPPEWIGEMEEQLKNNGVIDLPK